MDYEEIGKRYIGSAKIGTKGQIVIPKEVRDIFGLNPGDSVVILADKERGIALMSTDSFFEMSKHMLRPSDPGFNPNFEKAVNDLKKEMDENGICN